MRSGLCLRNAGYQAIRASDALACDCRSGRVCGVSLLLRRGRGMAAFQSKMMRLEDYRRTRDLGIDVRLGLQVTSITRSSTGVEIRAPGDTDDHHFGSDLVVHGAGRVPEIDDMRLDDAGIEWDTVRSVAVNEFLQSVSNPAVYAASDAAASAGPPLTPVAVYEGKIAAYNLLKGANASRIIKPNYDGILTLVFTVPSLASVGLQEGAARDRGLAFRVSQEDTSSCIRRAVLPSDTLGSRL